MPSRSPLDKALFFCILIMICVFGFLILIDIATSADLTIPLRGMPMGILSTPDDMGLAPGSMNDLDITPGDVRTTNVNVICHQSTKTVRNVSSKTKKAAFTLYHLTRTTGWCKPKNCEVDHLISLELGGSNDIKNLWPQPYAGEWNAHLKDALENRLHKLICDGTVTPQDAQYQISHDWISAYKLYIEVPADAEQDK